MLSAPLVLVAYLICWLFALDADERLILTPIACLAAILAFLIEQLWRRDRQVPAVDVGILCALITFVYIAVPSFFFIKSGFAWSDLSDPRLLEMKATPEDVAAVSWWVAAYLGALCSVYFLTRGTGTPGPGVVIHADSSDGVAILLIVLGCVTYQIAVERFFGVDLSSSNEALNSGQGAEQLPLFVAQVTYNVLAIGRIAKFALVVFAVTRKSWSLAALLVLWLCYEFYSAFSTLGARTYFVVLILAGILTIHRTIRPFGPVSAGIIGLGIPVLLLAWGYFRERTSADVWSANNEFQVLLANAIHTSWAYDRGIIANVPWVLTLSDLFMLIPQQLLPITKVDPANWYVDQVGMLDFGNSVGVMFGVIPQSKLGLGFVEIVARGAVLGAVLGLIHRQYVKNSSSFAAIIVYIWVCTSVYYTYRATTFYIATWALYRLLPFLLLFWFLRRVVRMVQGSGGHQRNAPNNKASSIAPLA